MSTIHVRNGFFGTSFAEALKVAKSRDVICLPAGVHKVPHGVGVIASKSLTIRGTANYSDVVIEGHFIAAGKLTLENVTVRATNNHCAFAFQGQDAVLVLNTVHVFGEPTGQYTGIALADGAKASIKSCLISMPTHNMAGLHVANSATAEIDEATLGDTIVESAQVVARNTVVSALIMKQGGQFTGLGLIRFEPSTDFRFLTASENSAVTLENCAIVDQDERSLEAAIVNSQFEVRGEFHARSTATIHYVEPSSVSTPPNAPVKLVEHEAPQQPSQTQYAVAVPHEEDTGTSATSARAGAADGDVYWHVRDARRFAEVIAPQLGNGKTLVLAEEGDYFLPGEVSFDGDICAAGAAERTVLHGTVLVAPGASITISGFTVKGETICLALTSEDQRATAKNVLFVQDASDEVLDNHPAVVLVHSAKLNMIGCRVQKTDSPLSGRVFVNSGSSVTAFDTAFGMLHAKDQAEAVIRDCSTNLLRLESGASITAKGDLRLRCMDEVPDTFLHTIHAADDAVCHIEHLALRGSNAVYLIHNSELIIDVTTTTPDDCRILLAVHPESVSERYKLSCFKVIDQRPQKQKAASPAEVTENDASEGTAARGDDSNSTHEDDDANVENPIEQINELIGLSEVKNQINSFFQLVRFNQLRASQGLKVQESTMHSLFLGPPGTGKTTVARLLGRALFEAGAIRTDVFVEKQPPDFIDGHATPTTTNQILESARGGVLFIDEAYGFYKSNNNEFAEEALNLILAFMENNRDDIVVIFAGYQSEMQKLLAMNPGLESRIPHVFTFTNYSPTEIAEIGYRQLLAGDYTVNEELYRQVVSTKYAQAVTDGNARWVREFNNKLVSVMVGRVLSSTGVSTGLSSEGTPDAAPADVQTITDDDLYSISGGDQESKAQEVKNILAELDGLIGLAPVKEFVRDLVAEAKFDQAYNGGFQGSGSAYHMVFSGHAGTGKTTVAKLIARLFYNLGMLQTSNVKAVGRADLVGEYVGQTEPKTMAVVKEAMGGVLFIDEAYQLTKSGGSNDFGRVAVETLLVPLEEDRDKFIAILAGYTDDMNEFMRANEGLRSRIPRTIEFPDYTPEEIAQIVTLMLSKYTFDTAAVQPLIAACYAQLPPSQRSNARWARNFAANVERNHKRKLMELDDLNPSTDILTIPLTVFMDEVSAEIGRM